jgi:hypothetical protein
MMNFAHCFSRGARNKKRETTSKAQCLLRGARNEKRGKTTSKSFRSCHKQKKKEIKSKVGHFCVVWKQPRTKKKGDDEKNSLSFKKCQKQSKKETKSSMQCRGNKKKKQ